MADQKWYDSLKGTIQNEKLTREIGTIADVLLAIIVFTLTFGLVDDFNFETLLEWKSPIRMVGYYLSIMIITRRFAKRADLEAAESTEEGDLVAQAIREVIVDGVEETKKIDVVRAREWIKIENKKDRANALEEKREVERNKLNKKLDKIKSTYDIEKLQPYKKWQIFKRKHVRKLKSNIEFLEKRIADVDNRNYVISFVPLELDDYKFGDDNEFNIIMNKKERYKDNASKTVTNKLRKTNMASSILFFALQGAILISLDSTDDLAIYALIMLFAFVSRGLLAYESTRRYKRGSWLKNQQDKLKDLKRMNEESKGVELETNKEGKDDSLLHQTFKGNKDNSENC